MVLYLLFLPLLGSIITLFSGYFYRFTALLFALATLGLSIYIAFNFSANIAAPQFLWHYSFIRLGVDGISLPLIILTALLLVVAILISWYLSKVNLSLFLLMGSLIIGTFSALDIFLFYIFFEATLIPMFYIIGIWGSKDKVYAAFKFFLFTLAGSVTFLLAVLYIYYNSATTSILDLPQGYPSLAGMSKSGCG